MITDYHAALLKLGYLFGMGSCLFGKPAFCRYHDKRSGKSCPTMK
jgi:hypothetical protein